MRYFPAFGIRAVAVAAHQLKFLISSCVESVYGGMEVRGQTSSRNTGCDSLGGSRVIEPE